VIEKDEGRKICQGCLTGNYFLCSSFPGQARAHAEREIEYRKKKARRIENNGREDRVSVYRRSDTDVV